MRARSIYRCDVDFEQRSGRGRRSARSGAKGVSWSAALSRRSQIQHLRRHLYDSIDEQRTDDQGDCFPKDFADWREIPSEELQRKELREALKRALDSLSPKYREVLILRDIQHLSIQETAQALSISEGSVKTRLLRARLQMRDALAPGFDGSWASGKTEYEKVRPW